MLRVCVLGELALWLDGDELALPRRRPARALLGWLALHPGLHARSTVAARLWPAVLDESARMSLRTSLSALRAVLPDGALCTTRERVGVADDVVVDSREFERLVGEDRLEEALSLERGELLAGFDEDWVLVTRDEHHDRVGSVLSSLARAAADRGDQRAAVDFARRRVALDPFDEAAHRELMQLLVRSGSRAGALAAYERLSERLRRELGVAPSPASRAVAAELRAGPAVGARPSLPARVTAARRRGTLLGRNAELGKLHAAWARSAHRGRRLVLVTGEPGIGKTRLVAEFAAELGEVGVPVLYGRVEEEALVPYQPLVEALGRGLAQPSSPSPILGDEEARVRLFEGVAEALDAIARGGPLLLVLDDLHWAEPPTVRLVSHLIGRPEGAPQMVVAAYRDTERHPFADRVGTLHREVAVDRIALGGLGDDAVAAMLGGDPAPEAVRRLREQTAGNPFFIEQLLPGEAIVVTETVSRRVGALGPEARAVLDAAAVVGAEFELQVVAEVLGLSVDRALDVLEAATKARLISEVPDTPGRYAFVHAIVRDTLASLLTAARRAQLHDLIAVTLEPLAERDPDRYLPALANHALESAAGAGDPLRAAELARLAAARAGAVLAYEDAASLLGRARAVLERRGCSIEARAETQCSLGEALMRAGDGDAAWRALAQAVELARAASRPDLTARAALARGGVGVTILHVDQAFVSVLEQALEGLGPNDDDLRVRLLARLAIELAYDPAPDQREAASSEALALARRGTDDAALAAALNARHVVEWGPDGCEDRLALSDEMLALAERAGNRELALQARHWRVVDVMELGDGAALRAELDAYAELSAEVRLPVLAWYVPLWRATLAFLEGRITEGIEHSRRAHALGTQAGDANADAFFGEHHLMRMVVQGRISELDPAASGVESTVTERSETGPAWRAFRFTFAWWHASRGELDEARRDFEAAIGDGLATPRRDVNWLSALSSASEASVLLRDAERAAEIRTLLEPYAARMVVAARGSYHAGSVAYELARLAALCGDIAAADTLFADAVKRDSRAGASTLVVRDLNAHGKFLRSVGSAERGDELLTKASSLWQSFDLA
jgi:DNA-binding SARP family transcriptional activator